MKIKLLTFFFLILPLTAQAALDKYIIDKEHTTILFSVNHLGYSDFIGRFKDFEGYFLLDEKNPQYSKVEVTINLKSIDNSSERLNEILQGEKWFNSEKFP